MARPKANTKSPLLLLVPALLLAGCGEEENPQRDVYKSEAECLADWQQPELCDEMPDEDVQAGGYHGHGTTFFFWGPGYYLGYRGVDYNGSTIMPATNRAVPTPFVVKPTSSAAARTTVKGVSSISRGGFGSTAKGLSGGG